MYACVVRTVQVFAAASEDMDTLCFESPILLRHLTFSEQRKEPIQEIHLEKAMSGLGFTREQVCSPPPQIITYPFRPSPNYKPHCA
jgi:hypothetical protein